MAHIGYYHKNGDTLEVFTVPTVKRGCGGLKWILDG